MTLIQRLSIAKAGGVRPLLELARTGSKQTREQAMWALWRASFTEEQKVAILETDALPLLVQGAPTWTSNTAGEAATAILRSLSAVTAHRPALVEAGAIPALIETVRVGNAGAKRGARIALTNLAQGDAGSEKQHKGNVKVMLQHGWSQGKDQGIFTEVAPWRVEQPEGKISKHPSYQWPKKEEQAQRSGHTKGGGPQ